MFGTIALVLAALIAAVLLFAATKPDTFQLHREATIEAAPEKIYPFIDDLRAWSEWSPWEQLDPDMTRHYEGPARGVGAAYEWSGSSKVGAGRMEVVEATPPSRVTIQLHFLKPFEAQNISEFTLEGQGAATRLVWAMHGPNRFISKVMQVFVSMDRMIGKDFEAGLANLKSVAERSAGESAPPGSGPPPLPADPQST